MEATIVSFRRGRHTQCNNQLILQIDNVDSKDKTKSLVGKHVVWTCPGKNKKEINGIIKSSHGNSGAVRAYFDKGVPGQALGTKIQVL